MHQCETRGVNKPADARSSLKLRARERGGRPGTPGMRDEAGQFGLELPGVSGACSDLCTNDKSGDLGRGSLALASGVRREGI